ncbi:MAG TPA: ATP-binding protein [Anaeromyxobacteraceae bacterium]|nr:ATP-binding protein [Anaeromyxobacteraceae bacterium]
MGLVVSAFRRLEKSLRARVLVPTAILFALTLAAMVWAAVELYASALERGQVERAELFAANVAGGITNAMLIGDRQQIPAMLSVVAGHRSDLASISLMRRDGRVVISSNPSLVGVQIWEGRHFDVPTLIRNPQGSRGTFAVVHPMPNGERCTACHGAESHLNGWLDLRFSRAPALAAQAELGRTLGVSAGVAFLVLLFIAWWLLGREAVTPLQHLVATMRRAESGDLAVRADEGRSDEVGVAARGFDATLAALRRSQLELEAFYRERMVRADRFAAVGEMATGLAHEIKNPLAGLSGALELLAEDVGQDAQKCELVADMRHQVARLAHTMESLLSYARPPKANLRSTDLNATLERVLFLVRQQTRGGALDVRAHLDPALPSVHADPSQLEQVFLNICLNACQAMNGAGGALTVRSRAADGRVAVEVEDTGPGIPDRLRANIFRPFFTTKRQGNGLGLAISARIVAEHGGHIGYRCPAAGGTVFTVTLQPARPGERASPEHAA